MLRQLIAASAVSLMATGAFAQNTINESGTGPNSTIDANSPSVDRVQPGDLDRMRADYDARFADYDAQMADMQRRLDLLDRGVEGARGNDMDDDNDIIDANTPEQDVAE